MQAPGFSGIGGGRMEDAKMIEEVQMQLRAQYIQEFYQTVRDKCSSCSFKACVSYPGSSLSGSEQKCLSRCMDRYQDATNIVTKAVLGQQA